MTVYEVPGDPKTWKRGPASTSKRAGVRVNPATAEEWTQTRQHAERMLRSLEALAGPREVIEEWRKRATEAAEQELRFQGRANPSQGGLFPADDLPVCPVCKKIVKGGPRQTALPGIEAPTYHAKCLAKQQERSPLLAENPRTASSPPAKNPRGGSWYVELEGAALRPTGGTLYRSRSFNSRGAASAWASSATAALPGLSARVIEAAPVKRLPTAASVRLLAIVRRLPVSANDDRVRRAILGQLRRGVNAPGAIDAALGLGLELHRRRRDSAFWRARGIPKRSNPRSTWADAAALTRDFHGRAPKVAGAIELSRNLRGVKLPPLTQLGDMQRIVYRTRKQHDDGKLTDYDHEFGKGSKVYAHPGSKGGPGMLIVHGPFKVQPAGIVG